MDPEKKSNGAFVGLIIIILILIIGGIYVWQLPEKNKDLEAESVTVTTEDSADLDALGQDLETTDTELGVDAGAVN